jgi:ABC-type thiamine transport system ATPase subunit
MNMHTSLVPGSAQDLNLTRLMLSNDVQKVERNAGRFVVLLQDGRIGVGGTVGEALEKAQAPNAENVLKVAA